MNTPRRLLTAAILALAVPALISCVAAGTVKPPAVPANVRIDVAPQSVGPGGEATVTVRLEPIKGIKINRYPRTKLVVDGADGLVAAGEASVGSDTPPPPDKMSSNYFEQFEPLTLTLQVGSAAPAGSHHVDAALTYFYCMPASGFCAPKREAVRIPLTVR